jgi:hypothetical protein
LIVAGVSKSHRRQAALERRPLPRKTLDRLFTGDKRRLRESIASLFG